MIKFMSLDASGLSDSYDPEVHGERPMVSVEEKKNTIEVSYIFPGFTMSDDDLDVDGKLMPFREVGVSGAGFVSESGKPLLPSFGRFVQIPSNCDYDVKVKQNKPVEFTDVLITPAQEKATDGPESEFEFDQKAYSEDGLYPEKIAEVTGPHDMDGYSVLSVHVRPLQYNPSKKLLLGYSNITVTIKLSPKEEADEEGTDAYPFIDPSTNREGFGNLVLNPSRSIAERLEIVPIRPPLVPIIPRGPEFIIIYDENLKKPAQNLAEWKNKRGLNTEMVSINTVGNSVAGIKKYVRDKRKFFLSRLRYVLLFGDVGNIVTEETGGNTTDHYFFTKTDPSGSSDCILPWVSGGRIPVKTEAEGNAVVAQIIRYEKNPPCDPEYYRRMTVAAYFQDNPPQDGKANRAYMATMEGILQHMTSQGFDVDRVYVSNNPNPQLYKDGSAVSQEVKNAIVDSDTATDMLISETSEGQLVIGHRDHGSENGWSEPPFQTQHLDGILSQYPSIFYSINCRTGRFDVNNPSECFAEAIMEFNGGPPSLIAATEYTGTWRNDSMMKALYDAMWPGVISTFPGTTASYPVRYNRLGDILNYSKSYLIVAHGSTSGVQDHFEQYHVIGDPTLQLWGDVPVSIRLRAWIIRNSLRIYLGACPKGSVITIWYRGRMIKRIAPSSTRLTVSLKDLKLAAPLPLPMPLRRSLSVCFSAPGCRFVEVKLRF